MDTLKLVIEKCGPMPMNLAMVLSAIAVLGLAAVLVYKNTEKKNENKCKAKKH